MSERPRTGDASQAAHSAQPVLPGGVKVPAQIRPAAPQPVLPHGDPSGDRGGQLGGRGGRGRGDFAGRGCVRPHPPPQIPSFPTRPESIAGARVTAAVPFTFSHCLSRQLCLPAALNQTRRSRTDLACVGRVLESVPPSRVAPGADALAPVSPRPPRRRSRGLGPYQPAQAGRGAGANGPPGAPPDPPTIGTRNGCPATKSDFFLVSAAADVLAGRALVDSDDDLIRRCSSHLFDALRRYRIVWQCRRDGASVRRRAPASRPSAQPQQQRR